MHNWNSENDNFIRKYYKDMKRDDLVIKFNEYFNSTITRASLDNRMRILKLKSNINRGCFKKGDIPFNKGLKQTDYLSQEQIDRTKATRFKKGNIPANHREVGEERYTKDFYIEIKIAEPNKWVLKHRYIYEKEHNYKLQSDEVVVFADGDRTNFDIDNLVLSKRSEMATINQNHLYYRGCAEATKVGIDIVRLQGKIKEREK